jgi:hypothetical protein
VLFRSVYVVSFCILFVIAVLINIANLGVALASIVTVALLSSGIGEIMIILAIIAAIVLVVVAIFMLFKIIWGLLKAFTNILLLTVFAPIQLTLGAVIPSLGFGAWVKSYLSNLAVFVVTGALVLFSFIFLSEGTALELTSLGLNPSGGFNFGVFSRNILIGSGISGGTIAAWPPLLGGGGDAGVGLLFIIASFVLFTLIPKANQIIQGFITGRPFAYGTAVGEAVAFVPSIGRAGTASGLNRWEKFREDQARTSGTPYRESWLTTLAQNTILRNKR